MTINSGELQLWQTVLFTAVKDALEGQDQERPELERFRADRWIRSNGKDFRLVCALAGLEPEFIRSAYIAGRIRLDLLVASETGNKRRLAGELVTEGRIGGDRRSASAAR